MRFTGNLLRCLSLQLYREHLCLPLLQWWMRFLLAYIPPSLLLFVMKLHSRFSQLVQCPQSKSIMLTQKNRLLLQVVAWWGCWSIIAFHEYKNLMGDSVAEPSWNLVWSEVKGPNSGIRFYCVVCRLGTCVGFLPEIPIEFGLPPTWKCTLLHPSTFGRVIVLRLVCRKAG